MIPIVLQAAAGCGPPQRLQLGLCCSQHARRQQQQHWRAGGEAQLQQRPPSRQRKRDAHGHAQVRAAPAAGPLGYAAGRVAPPALLTWLLWRVS
jgi:hypothetical protein